MIEKLKEHDIIDPKTDKVIGKIGCDLREIMDKLNELVDAVNTIQKEREAEWFEIQEWIGILEAVRKSVNVHEKQIDKLQMKVEPENVKHLSTHTQNNASGLGVFADSGMITQTIQRWTTWAKFKQGKMALNTMEKKLMIGFRTANQ